MACFECKQSTSASDGDFVYFAAFCIEGVGAWTYRRIQLERAYKKKLLLIEEISFVNAKRQATTVSKDGRNNFCFLKYKTVTSKRYP